MLYLVVLTIIISIILFIRKRVKGKSWNGVERAEGKTIVVTGANSGIGKALSEEFLRRGAKRVILACRNEGRANEAKRDMIQAGHDESRIFIELIDLMSFSSVSQCAQRIVKKFDSVDILVCNAGLMRAGGLTENGIESILQANYLGHFLLSESLLKKTKIGRIVFVSSLAQKHSTSWSLLENIDNPVFQYCRSKLAEVCYAKYLAGQGQVAFSCNPGVVHTNILSGTWLEFADVYFSPILNFFMKSPLDGAQTALKLSLHPVDELNVGAYYSDCTEDNINPLASIALRANEIYTQSLSFVKNFI